MPDQSPTSSVASMLADRGVSALVADAGSDASARGRGVAIALALGFVGAIGVAARPLYRAAFAARAVRDAAIQRARTEARREENDGKLSALLARLDELERAHASRQPLAQAPGKAQLAAMHEQRVLEEQKEAAVREAAAQQQGAHGVQPVASDITFAAKPPPSEALR